MAAAVGWWANHGGTADSVTAHWVRPGETIADIAGQHGTTIATITAANHNLAVSSPEDHRVVLVPQAADTVNPAQSAAELGCLVRKWQVATFAEATGCPKEAGVVLLQSCGFDLKAAVAEYNGCDEIVWVTGNHDRVISLHSTNQSNHVQPLLLGRG